MVLRSWIACALCMFAAFVVLAGRSPAQDLPTADALQARIDAASGSPLPSSYELLHYTHAGGEGVETIVRAGDDFRETDGYGPLQSARGRYQTQDWYQNANGQVVLVQPDPGSAVHDTYKATVTRVSVPFDAYVLARLNAAGSGTKDYVDPKTGRVLRHERIAPSQTAVTSYADFRTVDGYTTAWRWTVRDGHPENDLDYQIGALVARPLEKSEIEIPEPRRALVEFPAGKTSVDLPVTFVQDSFIVRVVINGRGLDFLLDTGAAGIAIDADVARQLGLREYSPISNAVNAGRIAEATAVVSDMAVGELHMRDVAVHTVTGLPNNYAGANVVGLLGFDFIAELMLRLDYERGHITAMENGSQVIPPQPHAVTLDVRLGTEQPMTTVWVNGSPGERFVIDTGDGGGLIFFDYFARRYPGALVDEGRGDVNLRRQTFGRGVGGQFAIKPYQLQSVKLGNTTFANFFGYLVTQRTAYQSDQDGLLGTSFLRNFTVWLDYVDSQVVLVLNSNGSSFLQ